MKKIIPFIVALGLLLPQLSSAYNDYSKGNTYYGGIGIVRSDLGYNQANVNFDYEEINYKLLLGYKYNNLALEAQYTTVLGEVDLSSSKARASLDTDGHSLGFSALYHFNNSLFAKIGMHNWDVEITNANGTSSSTNDKDLFYGLGYEIPVDGGSVRIEYEHFELGGTINDSMNNFSINAIWGF